MYWVKQNDDNNDVTHPPGFIIRSDYSVRAKTFKFPITWRCIEAISGGVIFAQTVRFRRNSRTWDKSVFFIGLFRMRTIYI